MHKLFILALVLVTLLQIPANAAPYFLIGSPVQKVFDTLGKPDKFFMSEDHFNGQLFFGEGRVEIENKRVVAWEKINFRIRAIPGKHFSLKDSPLDVIQAMGLPPAAKMIKGKSDDEQTIQWDYGNSTVLIAGDVVIGWNNYHGELPIASGKMSIGGLLPQIGDTIEALLANFTAPVAIIPVSQSVQIWIYPNDIIILANGAIQECGTKRFREALLKYAATPIKLKYIADRITKFQYLDYHSPVLRISDEADHPFQLMPTSHFG